MIRFIVFFSLVVSTFLGSEVRAEWWGPNNRQAFPQAFPAGREADGKPLFITQCTRKKMSSALSTALGNDAPYRQITANSIKYSNSWHIGKAGVHLRRGATYSYRGREKDCSRHVVFAPRDSTRYRWVEAAYGQVPEDAVRGFNDAEQQFVCRVGLNGGIHPGKLIPSAGGCFVGWGGREYSAQAYEVLVKD